MSKKLKSVLNFPFLNRKKKVNQSLCSEESCVLDAVPDNKQRKEKLERNSESSNNEETEEVKNENIHSRTENNSSKKQKDFETHSDERNKENSRERPYAKTENIFNITNASGFHFGNVITINNVNGSPVTKENKAEKMPKTVKALLECNNKIENAHMEFLSSHFGKQWKVIGSFLKLSSSELDDIEEEFRNRKERGYQMLVKWYQRQDQRVATVSLLSKLLWKSNIKNAKEAVEQLSCFIQELD